MTFPPDYVERVYAGVLGKITGVYLGRPVEGWSYERIRATLGPIAGYVHERLGMPLVVPDDDLSGTFTFLRALPDHGYPPDLTAAQVGATWLNYLVEGRSVLWWGGMGQATEHTAFLRLQAGVAAPHSGSIALNGRVVAEQIGAQIFCDGWALISPGDPERAAALARRAASVSHDGEALHGAAVIAALEALAFVEPRIPHLLDGAVAQIPRDSAVARLIAALRAHHAREPDWQATRAWLAGQHGYARYGGSCPLIPNHGLIILALLYGDGDLHRSLGIVTAAGWDTDCNAGNLGCLLGIRNGLAGFAGGPDWRGPVADRLYLSTADGGRAVTDALTEAYHVVNTARRLAGMPALAPKGGARFHWEQPGALQGWAPDPGAEAAAGVTLANVAGHSAAGTRSLAVQASSLAPYHAARVATPTFPPAAAFVPGGYHLLAAPTLYPGQEVRAGVSADAANRAPATVRLYLRAVGRGRPIRAHRRPRNPPGAWCDGHADLAHPGPGRRTHRTDRRRGRGGGGGGGDDLPRLPHLGGRAGGRPDPAAGRGHALAPRLGRRSRRVRVAAGRAVPDHPEPRPRAADHRHAGMDRLPRQQRDHAAPGGRGRPGRARAGPAALLRSAARRPRLGAAGQAARPSDRARGGALRLGLRPAG